MWVYTTGLEIGPLDLRILAHHPLPGTCKLCSPSQIGAKIPPKKRSSSARVPPFRRSAHHRKGRLTRMDPHWPHVAGPATLNGCANRIRDEGTAHHLMDNGYGFVWKGCLLIHWFTIIVQQKTPFYGEKNIFRQDPVWSSHPENGEWATYPGLDHGTSDTLFGRYVAEVPKYQLITLS